MSLDPRLHSPSSNPMISQAPNSQDVESVSSDDPEVLMKNAQVLMHTFEQVRHKLEEAYRVYENKQR